MKLIIQIPCYNEEKNLEETLNDLPKQIDGIDEIEYLIIDDGCTDHTVEVANKWGVDHIVNLIKNQGLAVAFMEGIDECLRQGADIIVNTDADNQYCGADVETIVRPILDGKADIVIGERPIDETKHFSPRKKRLQHAGSRTVRRVSKTDIPDAPSGFRAYSREAALHLNVVNDYTYTLEQIVQAGRTGIAITSVPIHTNEQTRPSRLFQSMFDYIKKSILTMGRAYMMYRPLRFFVSIGVIPLIIGIIIDIRYLVLFLMGSGNGHIQSLLLGVTLILLGVMIIIVGMQADLIAANRKILQEIQYRTRKMDYRTEEMEREGKESSKDNVSENADEKSQTKNIIKIHEDAS